MPRPPTLSELLRLRAAADPDAVALADDRGGRLTYERWDRGADAVARGLAGRGIRPLDRVALVFDNARWLDYAVSYLGALRVGAVAVPLTPRFPHLDLVRIIADCAPAGIVGPSDLVAALDDPGGWQAEPSDLEDGRSTSELEAMVDADDPAETLYGAGAMTAPSPRVFSGAEIALPPEWATSGGGGVFVHGFPLGSLSGQQALRIPLGEAPGAALVVAASHPGRLAEVVAEHRAEACGLTSALARTLLASGAADHPDLSSLTRVVVSPGPAPEALVSDLAAALPGVTVVVGADGATVPSGAGSVSDDNGVPSLVAPVAPSQEGMVWHEQFVPGSFNLSPLLRRIRGRLEVGALEAALTEILRRHSVLRTTFSIAGGRAVQRVRPAEPVQLRMIDLSALPQPDQEAELGRLVADARARPADLVVGPLFDPGLVRLGPDDHVLMIRVHHSIYDDWSVGLFRRELSALYRAFLTGEPSPLPPMPLQFADFCRRQDQELDGPRGAAERSFWAGELAGAPLSVQLPIDDPGRRPGSPHASSEPLSLELGSELSDTLRALAREHHATLFIVMLAAFAVLVQRYTGQDDLLLSSLVANRNRTELEGLIGCFGKKVLVRLRLSGDPTFAELVTRTRRAVMGAVGHQDLAYEAVVQEQLGPGAAAHGLIPQVGLKFQAAVASGDKLDLPGLEIGGVSLQVRGERPHFLAGDTDGRTQVDAPPAWGAGLYLGTFLGLSVSANDRGVRLVTEGVFHPPAVARLLRHFRTLVAGIAAAPGERVSRLPLLDDDDRARLLRWNDTATELPETAVHDAFAAQARRAPDRMAVVGERSLTYADLDARADELATRLLSLGVGPETPVGVCMTPTVEVVVAVLGIWKAHGAVVALDPTDTDGQNFVLGDAGLTVVVTDPGTARDLGNRHPELTLVEPAGPVPTGGAPSPAAAHPRDLACVFYGRKDPGHGVGIEHQSLLNLWLAMRSTAHAGATDTSTGLRVGLRPVPTSEGFLRQLVALLGGHTVVLVDDDPPGLVSRVGDGDVDVIDCTPGELGALLAAGLGEALLARGGTTTSAVRPVVTMASPEPVDLEHWDAWRSIEGADAYFLYGPPEGSFAATICPARGSPVRASIGKPVVNAGAHVLDQVGRPVPTQVVGELHLEGTILARDPWRRRGPTDAQLTAPDAASRNRRFATGRLARFLPDGSVELLGRTGDQTDLRGFRIEPARIQAVLAEYPGVAEVAVVLQDDGPAEEGPGDGSAVAPPPGPSAPRLVAYVVPEGAGATTAVPTLDQLRRYLWSRLPGYAWPAAMAAVEAIPRQADGKVDGHALARSCATRGGNAITSDAPSVDDSFLIAAWSEALGVDGLEADQNYWQSFSFLDALTAARQAGLPIGIRQVMRNRTLRNLAVDLAVGTVERAATRPRE